MEIQNLFNQLIYILLPNFLKVFLKLNKFYVINQFHFFLKIEVIKDIILPLYIQVQIYQPVNYNYYFLIIFLVHDTILLIHNQYMVVNFLFNELNQNLQFKLYLNLLLINFQALNLDENNLFYVCKLIL